jgi:REP element-mobilizing transposase RayT
MANSYTSMNIHFVFSTKQRENLIDSKMMSKLFAYMGGIANELRMVPLAIGGTSNHVHLLLSMPPVLSPSKGIQVIKTNSSRWIHQEYPKKSGFMWQIGYSGFSVSPRQIQNVRNYINRQEEHHRVRTFEAEYLNFLKESGIDFDEKYVWG